MQILTQEEQDHEPGLAVQPMAWVHRKVAVLGSFLHSELSSLGYAGAWPDFLAPTPEPGKPPFLYFLCPSPTLHSCGRVRLGRPPPATFPICCWPQPVPASSATLLPHLPWKGGTVQYLVLDGDAREGGVA